MYLLINSCMQVHVFTMPNPAQHYLTIEDTEKNISDALNKVGIKIQLLNAQKNN